MANRTKIHPLVARGIQQLVRGEATNVDGTPMTQQQFADALNVCADTVAAAVNGTGGYRYQSPAALAARNGSPKAASTSTSNGSPKAASNGSKAASNGSKAATEKEPTGETLPEALVLDALQDLAGAVRDLEHALCNDKGIDVRTAAYVHALGRRNAAALGDKENI